VLRSLAPVLEHALRFLLTVRLPTRLAPLLQDALLSVEALQALALVDSSLLEDGEVKQESTPDKPTGPLLSAEPSACFYSPRPADSELLARGVASLERAVACHLKKLVLVSFRC
jgi:hypothetical protein